MTTNYTICPDCGEDLEWHDCRKKAARIRELNDALRTAQTPIGALLANGQLFITHGVAEKGDAFIDRAMKAVREFSNFTEGDDPHGEHDFGIFELDGISLNWKIDCYDRDLKYGSADPSDPEKTRRVLTILLAEEY